MENNNAKYLNAKRKVRKLKRFYLHFFIYLIVIAMLLVINIMGDPGNWWFLYPATGWGLLVIIHGLTLGIGSDWEEKKIKELMDKDN
ncbi:2TM domain-containing protein [Pseudoneobacillus sp. C159]